VKCSLLTLSCYIDGELPAPRKGELEAHLVGCHRCRAGLGHLREEVERVRGLAAVHLPESSVRSLLEHTGLIGPGAPMPAVTPAAAVTEPPSSTPPWLRGGSGAALPWASVRPAPARRPEAPGPPSPAGPAALPAPTAEAAPDTFDIWAAAQAGTPAEATLEPPAAPRPAPAEPEAPPPAGGRASRRRDRAAARQAAAEAQAEVADDGPAGAPGPAVPPEAPSRPAAAGPAGAPPAPGPPSHVPAFPASGPTTTLSASELVSAFAPPEPASALSSSDPAPASSASEPPARPRAETVAAAVPPAGGDAVPARTPESSAETPSPRYPLTDEDALDEPTAVERFGPLPAPRPSIVDRLRERLALRHALRVASLDDRDDSVEIVSGPGAPARGSRSRADLARRRSEALRPVARPDGSDWEGDEEDEGSPARRGAAADELLPPPARPSASEAGAPPRRSATAGAGEPRTAGSGSPGRRGATAAAAAGTAAAAAGTSPRTVDGRRLTAVLGAAILLMFVVGVASARSTSPLPATSGQATGSPAPQHQAMAPPPPTSAAGPAQPPVAAVPQHAATPPLTGAVTVGEGAPGWGVQDIRYGAHPGYLRMVFDLQPAAGAASGSPRATLGFQDPTTLVITLDQVTARSAPAAPLAGGLVTSVSLLQPPPAPGSVAYVVKLSRPVQLTPSYASSPLRLIVDLR
jgi:Putative zinc-finger